MTSNCSEGPDCRSRAHRRTPDPGPDPPGGTLGCLSFTLADHHGSGRAHPHLQVSAGNAEEAELDSGGEGPGRKGREGRSHACVLRVTCGQRGESFTPRRRGKSKRWRVVDVRYSFSSRERRIPQVQIVISASQDESVS